MKPKVLITRKILPEALEYLKEHTDYETGAANRNLTKEELEVFVEDKKKEIFGLKNQLAMMRKLEKPHLINDKRKDIARALIVLSEKKGQ